MRDGERTKEWSELSQGRSLATRVELRDVLGDGGRDERSGLAGDRAVLRPSAQAGGAAEIAARAVDENVDRRRLLTGDRGLDASGFDGALCRHEGMHGRAGQGRICAIVALSHDGLLQKLVAVRPLPVSHHRQRPLPLCSCSRQIATLFLFGSCLHARPAPHRDSETHIWKGRRLGWAAPTVGRQKRKTLRFWPGQVANIGPAKLPSYWIC